MVKSNINDWIVCQPNNGSIVAKKRGSISCQNIKNVTAACSGVVPNEIRWFYAGPGLEKKFCAGPGLEKKFRAGPGLEKKFLSFYYFFHGKTDWHWPVHDPCGITQPNHKKEVSNPGGQIYLR